MPAPANDVLARLGEQLPDGALVLDRDVLAGYEEDVLGRFGGEAVAVAADDSRGREELWAYRESLNEAIRGQGIPHKMDIALPLAAIPDFDAALRERLAAAYPQALLYVYGHVGDGNLHINVVGLGPDDDGVDELVLRCTAEFAGTISAEHGVGVAKRSYLSLCRSAADIEAIAALKRALDPGGLLAPGRVLPEAAVEVDRRR